jgi:hypothetical protein
VRIPRINGGVAIVHGAADMNPGLITQDFRNRVCEQIQLEAEGPDRFRVLTPFRFEDGDHFGIVLKRDGDGWILTDEAHTMMHLSYWLEEKDFETGNRQAIVQGSLSGFSVEDRDGEFIIPITDERYGDALFNFVQALSKVTDVSFLSRERVRSTFLEDLRSFLQSQVPPGRLSFDWTDPMHDPRERYPVDFRINQMPRPLFIYALPTDGKVKDATINLLTFEHWGLTFQSLGIFEQQEAIIGILLGRFRRLVIPHLCAGAGLLGFASRTRSSGTVSKDYRQSRHCRF